MKITEFDIKKYEEPINIEYLESFGEVEKLSDGILMCSGLEKASLHESVIVDNKYRGVVLELTEQYAGIGMIDESTEILEGMEVKLTGELVSIAIGDDMGGKVVDATGRSLYDKNESISDRKLNPLFNIAPPVMHINSVTRPLHTGLITIDAITPIGRGQRQLIVGNRQTGKTQIALDTIINQKGQDVHCIYVSIGLKMAYLAEVIESLKKHDAFDYTTIVASTANDSLTSQYLTPYAGMAFAESLRDQGKDVLIIFDNLTKHADAYRAITLLFNRPPGREAYPGDAFYIHSSLLERAVQMDKKYGGGSITAIPIVEILSDDVTAYIPTNVISITDGQLSLKSDLFNGGQKPALDIGVSVSRIGGDAQLPIMRTLSKNLTLILSQYGELKELLDFGNSLDEGSMKMVTDGQTLLELFKQSAASPLSVEKMSILLHTFQHGGFTGVPVENISAFKNLLIEKVQDTEWFATYTEQIKEVKEIPEEAVAELNPIIEELRRTFM